MKASGFGYGAVVLGGWMSLGCEMYNAEAAFATDFSCPNAKAQETNSTGRFRVRGCGRTATYVCLSNGMCAIQTTSEARRPEPEGDAPRGPGPGKSRTSWRRALG